MPEVKELGSLLSDPHEDGMNFDQMVEEAATANKRIDETQNPIRFRWSVEHATSKQGNPQFILTGTVVLAGSPEHPRTKKSIIDQEAKFYVAEEPKRWDASKVIQWRKGVQSQLGLDIVTQKDPTVVLDMMVLNGLELDGDVYYTKSKTDPDRPFMQFRPTVIREK